MWVRASDVTSATYSLQAGDVKDAVVVANNAIRRTYFKLRHAGAHVEWNALQRLDYARPQPFVDHARAESFANVGIAILAGRHIVANQRHSNLHEIASVDVETREPEDVAECVGEVEDHLFLKCLYPSDVTWPPVVAPAFRRLP